MPKHEPNPDVVNLAEFGGRRVTAVMDDDRSLEISVPVDRRVSTNWVHSVTLTPGPGADRQDTFVSRWPTVGRPLTVNGRAIGTIKSLHIH
ncbi:TPA: hypothetical protein DIV49_02410 [Candidatus Saccharibacteria bacterium]|nr:hypothetical protein [Candidatus Saccharibacteria bacterium]HRJ91116.1 hypothetical protein [Candidatus Saccharibacteria bacterium]